MSQDNLRAAILAGGKGSRFRPYTDLIAKPMIPVGEEEKPLLEHIISWLSRAGVKDIVILVGYRGKQIRNYFRDGFYWGVHIEYSWDDEEYKDTGGSLLKAYRNGLLGEDTVIVWYGDILATVNIQDLLRSHKDSEADATIVVADKYQLPVGVARLEDGRIVELVEKPWYPLKATIGVLALETRVLKGIEGILGKSFDIMGHFIPWMIKKGYNVRGYVYSGPWYDVGSMERYAKLSNHLFDKIFKGILK